MLSTHRVRTYQGNGPIRNSSGNSRPQSYQLAEPLWTDPGLKESGIDVREPISIKKKKAQRENESSNLSPKSSQARKKKVIIKLTD